MQLRREELLHAKSIGPEIMLQFSDAILDVCAPVVIAPDLRSSLRVANHENAKGIDWDINQFSIRFFSPCLIQSQRPSRLIHALALCQLRSCRPQ